ncbi:MAG: L,D-transpeptidase family protein [Rhizobiaceae bacterium]|nr:L,D-transpeptidase family protein [Rhizobiaceae bacterium]
MFRVMLIAPAVAIGLTSTALSGPLPSRLHVAAPATTAQAMPVQFRDLQVFYDGNGNRVLVDPETGEVVAVQPRRYNALREQRRELRRERRQERYYLDDPEDMARLRRERMRENGIVAPEDDGYYPSPDTDYSSIEPDYRAPDGRYDQFPEAPRQPYVERQPLPDTVRRAPLERRPADGSRTTITSIEPDMGEPAEPATTGSVAAEPDKIDIAPMDPAVPPTFKSTAREDVAAIQILMDRAGASPGVIDGKFGSNVDKALAAYRTLTGTSLKSTDAEGIKAALASTGGEAFTTYTITPEDAAGPYVASIPEDYSHKAQLDHMSYTSVTEALAERFHMDEAYLKTLNPEANFNRPGTIIRVANVGENVKDRKVARVTADKKTKQVLAYDAYDKLVAAYPATIGSADTPSPTGTHEVSRIAFDPNYTYNPKINFKQGQNDKVLTIPPGPNGPVGSIWIALDKPTYGIHGTPEPSKIGKTESHGCIRLTNWDARELAKLVSAGTTVEFLE